MKMCLEQDDLINAKLSPCFKIKYSLLLELKNPSKTNLHSTISWFASHLDWNPTLTYSLT